jgi:polysaccharide export outer membrane protein
MGTRGWIGRTLPRLVLAASLVPAACGGPRGTRPPVPTPAPDTAAVDREIAAAADDGSEGPGDYRIGADDLLEVALFDIEDRNGDPERVSARVSRSGAVTLPLVGQVEVAGRTPVEAEELLRARFHRYIHDPQVTVFVKEYHSYRVSVVGYVTKPGVHHVRGESTLLDVLALAGGLGPQAGTTVQVTRQTDDRIETFLVDLERLSRDGDMRLNVTMKPGDVVSVPKAGIVYVHGTVKKPGAYRLREAMTVTQAIGAAGGPDEKLAKQESARLFRRTPQGGRVEVPVDLAAIRDGTAADVALVENDIVVVPMSTPKFVFEKLTQSLGFGFSVPVVR